MNIENNQSESPLSIKWLTNLFIRPKVFFSSRLNLARNSSVILVTWLYGVALAMDRIDIIAEKNAYSDRPNPLLEFVSESWLYFWGFVLALGVLWGITYYLVGGWWYKVRIRWSGDSNPDKKMSRMVFVYSSLIWSIPTLLMTLFAPIFSSNYLLWSDLLLPAVLSTLLYFLSMYSGYQGVVTVFNTSRKKAAFWFLIFPGAPIVLMLLFGAIFSDLL